MRIFGYEITRQATYADETSLPDVIEKAPTPVNPDLVTHLPARVGVGSWWQSIRESFAGAWQRGNITVDRQEVLTYSTVWACVTLIANDISKLWLKLVEEDENGICTETTNPAYSPVLRKPNHFQTRIKFIQYWVISLLTNGNTYVLKERDQRNVVTALYVLDPSRVTVMVAPNGAVFYELTCDWLSGLEDPSITVPARDIIHDVCVPLFHPLVGVSPIFACGMSAMQGLKTIQNSTRLFANGSNPGGILTAPVEISAETASRLEAHWASHYAGEANIGKVVVLGNGLEYKPMAMSAVDAEVVDQLKMTDERICATFHIPGYMVGIGPAPPYTDIQSINLQYYTQALQHIIENMETLFDEGLDLRAGIHAEFDLDSLSRMDTKTQMAIATAGVKGGIFSPNEGRARFDLPPATGGNSPMMQAQMFSLAALNKRDQMPPPLATTVTPPPTKPPADDKPADDTPVKDETKDCVACGGVGLLPERYMGDPHGQQACPLCPAGAAMAATFEAREAQDEARFLGAVMVRAMTQAAELDFKYAEDADA